MPTGFEARRADYERKKQALSASVMEARKNGANAKLALAGKTSSNLFRTRTREATAAVNVRDFNHVISIDEVNLFADVEGMTTYETFVDETLAFNLLPTVVPELKSITVGGAATGIGIESSSFRFGLVHETIIEMDILLGDGRVVTANATNEYKDLFFGFPNSYGTLGYALRLKVKLIRAKKFVKIERESFEDPQKYFARLDELCRKARQDGSADYIDGVVFAKDKLFANLATFTDDAPSVSDYTFKKIYYKSIPEKKTDYLTAHDYIWRWDTDWFWCSRYFAVEHPLVRRLLGKHRLRSTTYWTFRNFFEKHDLVRKLEFIRGRSEPVIQDVEIPVDRAAEFLHFFNDKIGITPVWVCPTMAFDATATFDLYAMDPNRLYINFGFWDGVKSNQPDGFYNRQIEDEVTQLHGKKSLYSTSYYSPDQFWSLYNKPRYDELKAKYDTGRALKDLYQKCVLRK